MSKGLMAATKGAGSGLANHRSSLVSRGGTWPAARKAPETARLEPTFALFFEERRGFELIVLR